jgi:hypothetical protein
LPLKRELAATGKAMRQSAELWMVAKALGAPKKAAMAIGMMEHGLEPRWFATKTLRCRIWGLREALHRSNSDVTINLWMRWLGADGKQSLKLINFYTVSYETTY